MNSEQIIATECPICLENIDGLCNRVVTDCGHAFHCACLMQNAVHNGFGCPYCRTALATDVEEEEDADDDDETIEDSIFEEDTLTSFRMFHQQLDGEEIEEEPEHVENDWSTVDGDEEYVTNEDERMPDAAYIARKLVEQRVSMEDLVKNLIMLDHPSICLEEYERPANGVYGKIRAIVHQYRPPRMRPVIIPAVAPLAVAPSSSAPQ
jgi:hypothetical protein